MSGDVNQQVTRLSKLLHTLQLRWVLLSKYTTEVSDLPWFCPVCRAAAHAKDQSWRAFKRHLNSRARQNTEKPHQVQQLLRIGPGKSGSRTSWVGQVGCEHGWNLIKEQQGETWGCSMLSLPWRDGGMARTVEDKANLLAAGKMRVPDPDRPHHLLTQLASDESVSVKTSKSKVRVLLRNLDEKSGGA